MTKYGMTLCVLILLVGASALYAQDPYLPISPLPLGDGYLSLPTPRIPSEGTWEVKFTHRFLQSLDQGDAGERLHSLFGLDSNADVGFGLSFAPRRDLQFSIFRSNTLDDIELAAKFVVLQQARAVPINISLRGGMDWRTEADLHDRTSFFAQVIIARQIGRKAEIFAIPTIVTNAGRAVASDRSTALFDYAVNVPLGVAVRIRPALSVIAELIPPNQELPDSMNSDLGWAIGLKRAIGGHYFEVLLTNSNATHADQYVTSTYQGSPLDSGNIHLGFNIERRFGRRRP